MQRLCSLQGEVSEQLWHESRPTDCVCGQGDSWPLRAESDFHNNGDAVAFIEAATRAAIAEAELVLRTKDCNSAGAARNKAQHDANRARKALSAAIEAATAS